ncbi:MAG: DedA family protein [Acidobacteriaceae bacterium]|nr:DedA family protein [Acidobacteriaceae bacterium]
MESLFAWVSEYGYAALFGLLVLGIVGLPVPDETLLVFSGYLIYRGRLHPAWTFAAGLGGSACGISLSYWIGRTLGYQAVTRYGKYVHLTPARLESVHRWFERVGEWLLAIGYFIPAVRHFTALIAGMSKLEYRSFAIFAYAGAAVWVATFLLVGYLVGESWQSAVALVQRYTLAFGILVAAAVVALSIVLQRRRR